MPIQSASFQLTVAATANETAALTTRTAQTNKRDTITFANGTGSLQITGVIDALVTVAANSTVTVLSTLTDTLEGTFAYTELKGWRIATPSTNVGNITVTSNITGFPSGGIFHPNASVGGYTAHANGTTITGTNTITVAGVNNDVVNVTLYVS